MYHSPAEIAAMTTEDFVKGWEDGSIVDSCLIELGAMKRSAADEDNTFTL